MKRTLILLAILLLLGAVYYYLQGNNKEDVVTEILEERAFAVDENELHKIVITEKTGRVNTLTIDEDDIWYVNGKRMSRNQKFLVKEALTKIRINSIPPKGAYKQIMKTIGDIGILVRLFDKEDAMIRSYYVGGVPQGERGTYYLMEGYNQPYLMELPGMEGSTRGRFVKEPDDWLDRAMFRYPEKDIAKITVDFPKSKNESYVVEKNGSSYDVKPLYSYTPVINKKVNKNTLDKYLDNFHIGFFTEAYINQHTKRDSIVQNITPFCNLTVENNAGEKNVLNLYPVNEILGVKGEAVGPNVDAIIERYFVNVNDGEKFMLTQHRLAKKFIWGYDWFFK